MFLSVITINKDNLTGLEKTIKSVLNQNTQDFEYLIIDGASTDGSKELVEQLTFNDKRLAYFVSEQDSGIYNAMNKAIKLAKGDYLLFLNSGDWLFDNSVLNDFINNSFIEDFVSGHLMLQEDIPVLRSAVNKNELGFEHLFVNSIMHQSTFMKRSLFDRFGLYNENLRIVSDWEFFYKCLLIFNCSYTDYDRCISCFDMTGVGSQAYSELHEQEKKIVFDKFLPLVYKSYKKLYDEFLISKGYEKDCREYMNLKNGKLGFLVLTINKLKRVLK